MTQAGCHKLCREIAQPIAHDETDDLVEFLRSAAAARHQGCVYRAIARGANNVYPGLCSAAALGDHNMISLIVSSWRDACRTYEREFVLEFESTLESAARGGHVDCMRWLMATHGARVTKSVICAAARGPSYRAAELVLERYAPPDDIDRLAALNLMLESAATGSHANTMQLAYRHGANAHNNALHAAAWGGNVDCMRLARARGARSYQVALTHAAERGHKECMKLVYAWMETRSGCPTWDHTRRHSPDGIWLPVLGAAARGGNLGCVELAYDKIRQHRNDWRWTDRYALDTISAIESAAEDAAAHGADACFTWFASITRLSPQTLGRSLANAARNSYSNCVKAVLAAGATGDDVIACLIRILEWDLSGEVVDALITPDTGDAMLVSVIRDMDNASGKEVSEFGGREAVESMRSLVRRRLTQRQHARMLDITLAFAPLDLPPITLVEISILEAPNYMWLHSRLKIAERVGRARRAKVEHEL